MWTRAELKENARTALKLYYWWAFLVCFIAGLLGGGSGGGGSLNISNSFGNSGSSSSSYNSSGYGSSYDYGGSYSTPKMDSETAALLAMVAAVGVVVILVVFVAGVCFRAFVSNVVQVGKLNFFLESRYTGVSAGVGRLFFGFSKGKYLNIVKTMFLKQLFEGLWTLLLIIPGIIKHYEYYMVPYLLADEPALDRKEAFRLSKEMMHGNKFDTWVLELSFIGWYLLGVLACFIGVLFVNPYAEATYAELYLRLKEKVFLKQQPQEEKPYSWDRTYTSDLEL